LALVFSNHQTRQLPPEATATAPKQKGKVFWNAHTGQSEDQGSGEKPSYKLKASSSWFHTDAAPAPHVFSTPYVSTDLAQRLLPDQIDDGIANSIIIALAGMSIRPAQPFIHDCGDPYIYRDENSPGCLRMRYFIVHS
jgi:hypothetical protein